jgi:S1-C subfamily serine protease
VAEVIGINTLKLIKKNVTGIGFALSASDVLEVLHRFYPNVVRAKQRTAPAAGPQAVAEISDAAHSGPLSNQILDVCFFSKPRIPDKQNDS